MELIALIARSLGWLSGALAGATAVLYALGFIATVSHQGMLGLDLANTSQTPIWYLGLGAQVAARWALQATLGVAAVLVAGEIVRRVARRLERPGAGGAGRVARVVAWGRRHFVWALAVLAMIAVGRMMAEFDGALGIRQLLFVEAGRACTADGVVRDLVVADRASLSARADGVVLFAVVALGLAGYAAPAILAGRSAVLPAFLCVAVLIQAIGAVPAAHGLFIMPVQLREIDARGEGGRRLTGDTAFLVARSGDGIWVWDRGARRLGLLAEGSFERFDIGAARSLRDVTCPPAQAG